MPQAGLLACQSTAQRVFIRSLSSSLWMMMPKLSRADDLEVDAGGDAPRHVLLHREPPQDPDQRPDPAV